MQIMLRFLLFAAQIFHSCGKVILLHGASHHTNSSIIEKIYICLSEDDGGALVWNDDITYSQYQQENRNDLKFTHRNSWRKCVLYKADNCFLHWGLNWKITHSALTPMGPVFDKRWEEFEEFNSFSRPLDLYSLSGAMSISVRSWQNVHIFICSVYTDSSLVFLNTKLTDCFMITLKNDSTDSTISYCSEVDLVIPEYICSNFVIRKRLLSVSKTEWRTFVISWNFWNRNVSVYDTNNEILTLETAELDVKNTLDPKKNRVKFLVSTSDFKSQKLLYRRHEYYFLHTKNESAILTSPLYTTNLNTPKKCIQFILGLCAECIAKIVMIDSKTHKILDSATARGSLNAAIHGLPMWQLVTLDRWIFDDFSTFYPTYISGIKIRIVPKLIKPTHNPLWAIGSVRRCPNRSVLRKGIISQITNDSIPLSNITCQKLFFNENTVISSLSKELATNTINLDDNICPEGRIGPDCSSSCKYDLNSPSNCSGTMICYKSGCVCSPGFQGDTCSDLCDDTWYGYNCTNKCGFCKSVGCNKVTGECINGCVDSLEMIYKPPLCNIGINKITEIVSVTSISIQTKVPIEWKKENQQIMIKYSFTIKGENYIFTQSWNTLFQNMTYLMGYFNNLTPGSIYSVKCVLLAENEMIETNWQIVETDCDPANTFNVLSTENSIIIDWQITADQLFPCPAHWYYVTLQNKNTDEHICNSTVINFPYKLSDLPPYTVFNVTLNHLRLANTTINYSFFYFTLIRTLRSVTTKVLSIQYVANSSTQVTLKWNSPDHLHIVQYEITLKIIVYYGCEDLNLPTSVVAPIKKFTNNTEIIFSDLHPYASYSAQVTAHEFQNSSSYGAEIFFTTNKSDIPAEVFTKLKIQNWTLSWQPPKDCSTISGPLHAKIHISGVSTAVKHFSAIEFTSRWYIDLNIINSSLLSDKQYRAIVYVVREYNSTENSSAFQELCFNTPSTNPPTIANLEIVEIDTSQIPHILHLRWLIPLSSLNQQFHYYNVITYCNHNANINKVKIKEYCDLWDDYVCVKIYFCENSFYKRCPNIHVLEINKTNTVLSSSASVSQEMFTTTKPDRPASVIYTLHNNSIVDLLWYHPWKTSRQLHCFLITVKESTSYLKQRIFQLTAKKEYEYLVEKYMRNYTERLYLYPSTLYRIHIRSMTVTNETSLYTYINVQTPSTAKFDGDLYAVPDEFNCTILLKVPHILNDTFDSCIHIIVEGSNRCKNYSKIREQISKNLLKQANLEKTDGAWQAAEISTDEIARNNYTFIVGDNKTYGGSRNCPLQPNRFYKIIVILTEQRPIFRISNEKIMLQILTSIGEVPDSSLFYKLWFIPIILLLLVVATVSYIYRRRRRQILEQIMSQNEMEVWQTAERMTVFSNNRNT